MRLPDRVPMVRCLLDTTEDHTAQALRYVPLVEFDLWRYLMENKHRRRVTIDQISVWVPEDAHSWNSGFEADDLEPVLRLRFDRPGPGGMAVPVERYFPAETYPQAQEALLHHFDDVALTHLEATPGYFVPVRNSRQEPVATVA